MTPLVKTGASANAAGIRREWSKHRVRQDLGHDDPRQITYFIKNPPIAGLWLSEYLTLRAYLIALQFSLMAAFRIGWRDFNVGNWISQMQFREYTLRPTGWVRFASGVQSLISVYLLALWILSYFGRPFE